MSSLIAPSHLNPLLERHRRETWAAFWAGLLLAFVILGLVAHFANPLRALAPSPSGTCDATTEVALLSPGPEYDHLGCLPREQVLFP